MSDAAAGDAPRDLGLDGLRGLAILLVVLYHAKLRGAGWLSAAAGAGWLGVDLFFVLSGFLITRILLEQRASPSYYRAFYARRALRILPLYWLLLAAVLVLPALGVFGGLERFWAPSSAHAGLWYWVFLGNLKDALAGGFQHQLLAVTWSLAIEEHFYLAWPVLVRHFAPRLLERACLAAIALALCARGAALLADVQPLMLYIVTPFRPDGLALGAWIALAASRLGGVSPLAARAGPVFGLGALAALALVSLLIARPAALGASPGLAMFAHPLMQTLGYPLVALGFSALLVGLLAAPAEARVRRAFEAAPLRALGRYSYAIYLLHVPIIFLAGPYLFDPLAHGWPPLAAQLGIWVQVLAACVLAGAVSWRLLEGPALGLRRYFPFRPGPDAAGIPR